METHNFENIQRVAYEEGLDLLGDKAFADEMRNLCSDKNGMVQISGDLWIRIADRVERSTIISGNDKSYIDEIAMLKKELDAAANRAEGLERKVMTLENECEEGRKIVEFQKGKIEAYEFALRCLGGKDGNY